MGTYYKGSFGKTMNNKIKLSLIISVLLVSACGQKGDLYLPDQEAIKITKLNAKQKAQKAQKAQKIKLQAGQQDKGEVSIDETGTGDTKAKK